MQWYFDSSKRVTSNDTIIKTSSRDNDIPDGLHLQPIQCRCLVGLTDRYTRKQINLTLSTKGISLIAARRALHQKVFINKPSLKK